MPVSSFNSSSFLDSRLIILVFQKTEAKFKHFFMEVTCKLFWSAALGEHKIEKHMALSASTRWESVNGHLSHLTQKLLHTHPVLQNLFLLLLSCPWIMNRQITVTMKTCLFPLRVNFGSLRHRKRKHGNLQTEF